MYDRYFAVNQINVDEENEKLIEEEEKEKKAKNAKEKFKFPENPDDLLPDLSRDDRGRNSNSG